MRKIVATLERISGELKQINKELERHGVGVGGVKNNLLAAKNLLELAVRELGKNSGK